MPSFKSIMKLTITNVQQIDYGIYKCVAKNPRGETDGTIRLYCKFLLIFLVFKLIQRPHISRSNVTSSNVQRFEGGKLWIFLKEHLFFKGKVLA